MESKTKNIPKLRFPEFEEEWNIKKMMNLVERISLPVHVEENVLYQQIGIRSHGKGIFHKELVTGKSLGNKRVFWIENNLLVFNIIFAWEQALAKTTDSELGMIASHRFPMYKNIEGTASIDFILIMLLTPKGKHLLGLASPGGAGRNKTLGQKSFADLKISLPTLPEQKKIASFHTAVDDKINKLTRKKELLQQYKKGIMQGLFNQKVSGKDTKDRGDQLRFKDKNGKNFPDWEVKKLGEVSENISYGMNSASMKYDGINKYIRITDIDPESGKFMPNPLTSPDGNVENKYKLKKGDIVFARTGASVGKTYIYNKTDGTLYFAGFLIKFSIINANPYFIYSQTQTYKYNKWVAVMSMRSGQPGINAEEYKSFNLTVPVLEEQQKIADFLSRLDKKIEHVNTQIEKTQEFKKGLLQQMFV